LLTSDPKLSLKNVLVAGWNPANTSIATAPRIHTGWYNSNWGDVAQVTITTPIESPIRGGETGFMGMGPGGSGVQVMLGNLIVGTWAHHDLYDGVNAKTLTWEMSKEVQRIIQADIFAISDLEWINWISREEIVDTLAKPPMFRYNNGVRYAYRSD
jgi:hypothetical protein